MNEISNSVRYKLICLREASRYLKSTCDTLYSLYYAGFKDGEEGKSQEITEPNNRDGGIVYAAELFAVEIYKKGYEEGSRKHNENF